MPHDLSAAAAANGGKRRADAAARVATDPSGRLVAFRTLAEASAFSTNVFADKIIAFDETGEVLHKRALDAHRPRKSGAGVWPSRQAFEDLWLRGEEIIYGAVNAGTMGVEEFGQFCLVADPEVPPPDGLGAFPSDSAQTYVDEAGRVYEARALADVTSWRERAALVVVERGSDALREDDRKWPEVVCAPERYLEVCRIGELPVGAVTEVRVRTAYRDTGDRLLALDPADVQQLTDVQFAQLGAFKAVNAWSAKLVAVENE